MVLWSKRPNNETGHPRCPSFERHTHSYTWSEKIVRYDHYRPLAESINKHYAVKGNRYLRPPIKHRLAKFIPLSPPSPRGRGSFMPWKRKDPNGPLISGPPRTGSYLAPAGPSAQWRQMANGPRVLIFRSQSHCQREGHTKGCSGSPVSKAIELSETWISVFETIIHVSTTTTTTTV